MMAEVNSERVAEPELPYKLAIQRENTLQNAYRPGPLS
jgi:hypothetical protein